MRAIHVTGSDSFLCQGDFLNGTSPSGELTMLKACFTIKTIHNYSELTIIFYHSFSSHMERGHRWDQDLVYCHARYRLYTHCTERALEKVLTIFFMEAHKNIEGEVSGLRWQNPSAAKMGTQPETLYPGILLPVALDIFSSYIYLNHWNDELNKRHVLWSTIYCIYTKQIICSLRLVEIIKSDKLIRKKCRMGVTEKLVFYSAVPS